MKKILITGTSGFLGSNILRSLVKSNTVYATTRKKIIPNHKNLKYIFFYNHSDLIKKLKKIRVNAVIHCATHYIKTHRSDDIPKITKSNIEFGNIILENLNKMRVKKFINFCTVWQNYNSKKNQPYNLYAASKNAFIEIINYYKKINRKTNFYNIYIADTFGDNDKRKKLINILKNGKRNKKKILIESRNLSLNLLDVKDVINAILVIVKKKIKDGDYNLINDKNFNIFKLIKRLNKNKKFKKKIVWVGNKKINNKIFKIKKLPYWKPKYSNFEDLKNFITGK